jgi:DNA-binding SARP family transcriptional activator/tetratricopeptide (TPR) repeat protein
MFHIQSLGGVAVRDDRQEAVHLRSRKHLALLLYLAAGTKRVLTREYLASLLWSTDLQRARHSLSQAIYDLRRNLNGALLRGPGDAVRLDTGRISFDAAELERAVKKGDLALAVELYRGPFAENLADAGTADFERWVEGERHRYARMGELVLRRYVRECNEAGSWGEMCVAALKLVRMSALDEEAHRALMRGLWMHGDATSAMRHFEEVAPALESELPDGISEETRDLVQRIRSVPVPRTGPAPFVDREPPFMGREKEFEFLRSAVSAMGQSPTTAVIVLGEAGIGKTRLLRELAPALILDQVRILESRCYPAEAELPYGPVVEGIRPIASEVARTVGSDSDRFTRLGYLLPEFEHLSRPHEEGVDPAAWRRRLYEEVANFVRRACSTSPLVWMIEDVQWIDATSASLLHYITRRLEGDPFLLVASMRVGRDEELPSSLPVSAPGSNDLTKTLRLTALSEDHIRRIVLHLRPDAERHRAVELAQHLSEGNPSLAIEVFRAAVDSLEWAEEAHEWGPLTDSRLRRVLSVRFEGLSRSSLRVLKAIAILERHATPAAVAAVAAESLSGAADHSAELYERGLIQDAEGSVEFANDVIREYVYADMSSLERAAMHLGAARYLAGDPNAGAGTLARHYHLGGDRARTHKYSMKAAQEAEESGGHSEAAAMATLALNTATSRDRRLTALNLLAAAELGSAQLTAAKDHFEQILRLDPEMSLERRIEVKLRIVQTLAERSQWSRGRELLQEVAAEVDRIEDPSNQLLSRSEALYWSLKIAIRQNDSITASRVAEAARAIKGRTLRDGSLTPDARASALLCMAAYSAFFESSKKAMGLLAEADEDLRRLSPSLSERIHLFKGMIHLRMARWDQGEYQIRQALAIADRRRDVVQLSSLWNNLACCSLEQGDWDSFNERISKAQSIHIELPDPLDAALPLTLNQANALFYQGRPRDAGNLYDEALEIATTVGSQEFFPELLACKGLVSLQTGNSTEVKRVWSDLQVIDDAHLGGSQERFKLPWFRAFVLRQADEKKALEQLIKTTRAQEPLDIPSHLKLAWLGFLLFGTEAMVDYGFSRQAVRERMQSLGLAWFAGFSQRWLRVTASKKLWG